MAKDINWGETHISPDQEIVSYFELDAEELKEAKEAEEGLAAFNIRVTH
jgi:hypothetical protein